MKTKYLDFINEKYNQSPDYTIKVYFDDLEKKIRRWFEKGVFASNKAELSDIKRSNLNEIEKCMIVDFTDSDNYFQMYFILSLQDVGEDSLDTIYVKVKKYNSDSGQVISELGEDINANKISEDKIIQMFSDLNTKIEKDESGENDNTVEEKEENPLEKEENTEEEGEESQTDF